MRRRQLLQLALPAAWLRLTWAAADPAPVPAPDNPTKSLILIELQGGNDGLNTLVPYTDPAYYALRPRLAIARDQVLTLDERLGLHPALAALMPAWRDGELAVVLGVGYEQQNRSHFRSIEIWESASDSTQVLDQGWVAQALPGRRGAELPDAVVLAGGDGAMQGGACRVVTLQDPAQLVRETGRLGTAAASANPPRALAHVLSVRAQLQQAGQQFRHHLAQSGELPGSFPDTPLGKQFKEVAHMLAIGLTIPVFKLQLGGFDTHVQQRARQDQLLTQLADAVAAFRRTALQLGCWDRVLIMSYSEFGRRVAENANAGTDHGAAAPQFVMGGRVKGGFYGAQPSLTALTRGDLNYTTDYRRLYTTVAQGWWGTPPAGWGNRFPALGWL